MSRVKIEDNQLVVTMKGARKFFALKSEFTIPLENIAEVTIGLAWKELPKLLDKRAGTNANSFYLGGIFVQDGDKVFYDIKRKEEAVVITLRNESYERLIIGVEDPYATVKYIEEALNNGV